MKKLITTIILLSISSFLSVASAEPLVTPSVMTWLEKLKGSSATKPVEKVTLQLKWLYCFQFAGYYAAQEQGYYRVQGLTYQIDEGKPERNLIDKVLCGENTFGVGTSDLLILKAKKRR